MKTDKKVVRDNKVVIIKKSNREIFNKKEELTND